MSPLCLVFTSLSSLSSVCDEHRLPTGCDTFASPAASRAVRCVEPIAPIRSTCAGITMRRSQEYSSMREYVDGATAIVRGALAAGCDFFAGYPITPASPILMAMMRELPRVGRRRHPGRGRDRLDRDVHRRHPGRGPGHDRHQRARHQPLQREHRPGDHGRGAARDRRTSSASGPATGGATTVVPGRRAVRALGHLRRLPDHRPGPVDGRRVRTR